MSDKFTVKRLQLNVETEELGAAFSPNRPRVLTAVDRTVLLFDVETGHSLRKFEHTALSGPSLGVPINDSFFPERMTRERRHSGMEPI